MVSTSGYAMADEVDLVGHLSPVIGVGDEEDTVAELEEWPCLKGSRVEYLTCSSQFREFCKAKICIDGIWGHAFRYKAQFNYWLTLPLSNLAKSVMNMIVACPAQLNCNFWEVILVCETLNERWAASGVLPRERRIAAKDFLEYYAVKYRSDEEPLELNNRTITKGISYKVLRKESFIDAVARENTELEIVLKELEISRFKRVASKDDKVRRSQAKMRMAGKTPGSMEERLLTLELNTPLKLMRLNKMPDEPVDMATVSNTIVVLEESDKIAEGADARPRFEVEAGLLEQQCRAKAREKMVAVVDDEFKKFARGLGGWGGGVQPRLQDRSIEMEKRISQHKGEKNQFEENLTREREAFQLELEKEREAAALKLKEVRAKRSGAVGYRVCYFLEQPCREAPPTEGIGSSRLRVVVLEGLLEVEKKSFAESQKELVVAREREEKTLLYNTEYAEEYEALISQYEDRLDDNVKLSLKLKEAKSQVQNMNATILSRDLALN
ncbi:hypothetical protein GIB67_014075 [Kingdonia uniflora]|uniref:Uncharacterized protein n=1 Tax=Kingdonia uniflora TaxID=39325 RepID=A0A7J7KXF7_9MAGN|nr:hypothetical protein GIB67_014075 [Kingdonia uniflora]